VIKEIDILPTSSDKETIWRKCVKYWWSENGLVVSLDILSLL